MRVTRPSARRALAVLVAPLRPTGIGGDGEEARAVVFVTDPEERTQTWREVLSGLYGFTRAETEVTLLLLEGATVGDIVRRRGTTANTVRTHLKRIFDKLGARSQADLVRRLLSGPTGPKRPSAVVGEVAAAQRRRVV
jgi:DNA-binding CsgD family transcriptional regulator